jgi:hypothetical protein
MTPEPLNPLSSEDEQAEANDLFSKLDSLMQKHQGGSAGRAAGAVPMLTEPVEEAPASALANVPVLLDAIEADDDGPQVIADKRRQMQVALYLRLRQRLDEELNAVLADNLRLGDVAVDPIFSRVAEEMRSLLPIVVRESVDQVFGLEFLEASLVWPRGRGSDGR